MKKRIVILCIVILFTVFFVTIFYNLQNIQFAGAGINQLTATGIGLTLLTCNPSFVPQSIEEINAELDANSSNIGSLTVENIVSSDSNSKIDMLLEFTDFESMKTFVDWILNNENPYDFQATVLVKTKILNIFPYTYEKNYNFSEFSNLLFGHKEWSCRSNPELQDVDIKGQLISSQARFSASELLYSDKSILAGNLTKSENQSNVKNALEP